MLMDPPIHGSRPVPVSRSPFGGAIPVEAAAFHEAATLSSAPIRALNLSISGTWLEPVVQELLGELQRLGIVRVRPRFYLSTEWGVPFNTIAVAIPF